MLSADRCASCAPLVAAPRSLRQRCAPLVGSGSTQRCQQAMLLQFQAHGCSVDRFAGAEALHRVGQSQICTHVRCAERHLPSPHSAILSCDQLRASPTPQVSRGRRAASETSRPSSAHDGAAFFGSLPRKHTSNPSQRSLRTPRTPPRPPKHPICHIAILSVSMTKASSPPVALSKHIKTTTNLNCAAPAHRNRVLPRAVRPQSAPAASMNRNRALGAARARARRLKNGMAGRRPSQLCGGASFPMTAHPLHSKHPRDAFATHTSWK